ncbi:homeobox protein ATH1-like isoform X4 [Asparagus officinalis]|uniref:homeobox protein ATH1-like isoform X4 n=1 Tax=Asparagus officinalis TaxID=4686 RepID=UPI00098E6FC9|nr:homeobox protein ATH1-like isoform X4 [Asparagus officinalis]
MENDIFSASLQTDQSHTIFNAASSHIFSSSLIQPSIIDHNTNERIFARNPLPSNVQEEFLNNLYVPNYCGMPNGSSFEAYNENANMGSLSNFLPMNMRSLDSSNLFNSDYEIRNGPIQNEFMKIMSTVHPSYHVNGSTLPRNELSLSLGSSEKSSSVVTQATPKESEELSLYCGPLSSIHFSHVLSGSRYIDLAQEILGEVVNYAVGNFEEIDDSFSGIEGSDEWNSSGEMKSREDMEQFVIEENKAEKNKLVAMLQMVDHSYKQYLDNIQKVISTFYDASNSSSPQILAHFALHTLSSTFKNLRERIQSHILLSNEERSRGYTKGKEKYFEHSFIQKQWTLQMGRKDQQCWRPQRGLPERSVSVLRAWMFQNFLHPYPKDNDKHLLALQSGLTRSQVSNWFINARVRLWKPMIEEMYSEIRKHQTDNRIESDFECHGNISNPRRLTN